MYEFVIFPHVGTVKFYRDTSFAYNLSILRKWSIVVIFNFDYPIYFQIKKSNLMNSFWIWTIIIDNNEIKNDVSSNAS